MIRKKIAVSALLISLNLFSIINGQESRHNWFIIHDSKNKVVYVDTSNINLTDNQLFVRSIIMYREPVFMNTLNQEVKKSKSHLVMDVEEKTYSVAAAIFYDINNEIIPEADEESSDHVPSNYSLKIHEHSVYKLIMDKSLQYLNTNRITVNPSEYIEDTTPEIIAELNERNENKEEEVSAEEIKEEAPEKKIDVKPEIPLPVAPKVELPKVEKKEEAEKPKVPVNKYDSSKEKIVKGMIFSDGNTFCYQVSSWKKKRVAESEVARLKKKGYDAFYVQAEIPGRGTWYRVRVGYFDSLKKASADQAKFK